VGSNPTSYKKIAVKDGCKTMLNNEIMINDLKEYPFK